MSHGSVRETFWNCMHGYEEKIKLGMVPKGLFDRKVK